MKLTWLSIDINRAAVVFLAKKIIYSGVVICVFMELFILSNNIPIQYKFQLFGVPALNYQGGDSRNIQLAAHCYRIGEPIFGAGECMKTAGIIKAIYPEAHVPALNYPSVWVKLYSLFADDSEQFFKLFWVTNALLLVSSIFIYCFRYDYRFLPIFLFSPITLLAIERGNTDGATFFLTFAPLLIFSRSQLLQSFFIALASALKIFPIFGYIAFFRNGSNAFISMRAIWGLLLSVPLLIPSFFEIPMLIDNTSKGFTYAYGMFSLQQSNLFNGHAALAKISIAVLFLFWIALLVLSVRSNILSVKLNSDFDLSESLEGVDTTALLISASIFVFSFIAFTNWSYRLVFLIPVFVILAKSESSFAKIVRLNILLIFIIPIFPKGWDIQNIACFPLAVFLSYTIYRVMLRKM